MTRPWETVQARLDRVLHERVQPATVRARCPLAVSAWTAPGEPVPAPEALGASPYVPVSPGTAWGTPWGTTWFHATGTVPPGWQELLAGPRLVLEARVDLGFNGAKPGFQCEGLAFTPGGQVVKGLEPRNDWLPGDAIRRGDDVDFYVEAASNPDLSGGNDFKSPDVFAPTPFGHRDTAPAVPLYLLGAVELVLRDTLVSGLLLDLQVAGGLARELDRATPRHANLARVLERALDVLDPDDVAGTAAAARAELAGELARPAHASAHRIVGIGHAHIDSAWLWPVRETARKCARTFSNVLALMDTDDEVVFGASSAQQYAWVKEHHPELFERIRARVAEGRFVPLGGMWVEADTNLPGGEALVRQFVQGRRFFASEFGVEPADVWLPDSFGYTGALPQLVAGVGARWFFTQKMCWSETNQLPHHTFLWEGIDGTRVLTHLPPVNTYSSDLSPLELARSVRTFTDHGRADTSLLPFGYGDGGGGPTREMMALARRQADLEGSPRVRVAPVASFYQDVEAAFAAAGEEPPVWRGELYLEFHRGTYTSQAGTKRGNRRSEHLLREAELWAATAAVRAGLPYPYEQLDRIWQVVLLQQFHDILPGTAIAWVHREAERNYAAVAAELEEIIASAAAVRAGPGTQELLFNAAPHARDGVPALGAAPRVADEAAPRVTAERGEDGALLLGNGLLSLTIDADGLFSRLVDLRADRDVLAPGTRGNLLQLHRDTPTRWDAWDVDVTYRSVVTDLTSADEVALAQADDAAATVRVRRTAGDSTITQEITVRAASAAVEIVTTVDWAERQKLLKLAFGLDVHAEQSASETQFGHQWRPTHENTSWDCARFEICAHRWVHVGETGYGAGVTNDASYGHDVTRTTRPGGGTTTWVRQSLLRAPLFPDPDADRGRHTFRTHLLAGAGVAETVREGYRTNLAPRVVPGGGPVAPLIVVEGDGVVIEAVKLAEDRSGDVVVRLYEALGGRARVLVRPGFAVQDVAVTDLLERPEGVPERDGDAVRLQLRPFQVTTLRFAVRPGG